jgi:hypothetical protein
VCRRACGARFGKTAGNRGDQIAAILLCAKFPWRSRTYCDHLTFFGQTLGGRARVGDFGIKSSSVNRVTRRWDHMEHTGTSWNKSDLVFRRAFIER